MHSRSSSKLQNSHIIPKYRRDRRLMAKSALIMIIAKLIAAALLLFAAGVTAAGRVFEVGDDAGWAIPPSKNSQLYNQWASKNRFKIGDSIEFKYDKDSVMGVTEEDYDKCNSAHPTFYSNNGDTSFKFAHSGNYYFISGVSGHCERGQKMIVKVMGHSDQAPTGSPGHPANETASPPPPAEASLAGCRKNFQPLLLCLLLLALVLLFV